MSDKPKYRDEEWLREQYIDEQKSQQEIADICGCHVNTVRYWFDKNNIEGRPISESNSKSGPWDDESWLQRQYIELEKSTPEIAEEYNVSRDLILNRLRKYDIPIRAHKKGRKYRQGIETYRDADWLRKKYVEEGYSSYEIVSMCEASNPATIIEWLHRHNISVRERGFRAGEEHRFWNGGEGTHYGKGWTESKKQSVRERDDYTCQDPNCEMTQEESLKQHGFKLDVHHLQKAKRIEDPEERNAPENLITLCRECHRKWEKIADAGLVPQIEVEA